MGIAFIPEKASAILAHGLDDVPLPPHHPLKPQVLLSPLGFSQGLTHVAVLILTIVPLKLKVNLYLMTPLLLAPKPQEYNQCHQYHLHRQRTEPKKLTKKILCTFSPRFRIIGGNFTTLPQVR